MDSSLHDMTWNMFRVVLASSRLRWRIGAICALALSLSAPTRAQDDAKVCEQFGSYGAIFVGQVGAKTHHSIKVAELPPETLAVYPVLIEEAFRGVTDGATVYLYDPDSQFTPNAAARYLVRGNFNFPEVGDVVAPSSLIPVGEAAPSLAFLHSQNSTSEAGGRIYGTVLQGSSSWTGSRRPMAGLSLRIHVGDFLYETVTGAGGEFAASGLPEGLYWVEPVLPPQLAVTCCGGRTIHAGGCVSTSVLVQWNGRIRGRVALPDQSPLRSHFVDLVPLDANDERGATYAVSDAGGLFEFAKIQPGRYLVGVNLRRAPRGNAPFPPTYFPGTINKADARVIEVGEGNVNDAVDFDLPVSLATGQLEIYPQAPAGAANTICVLSVGTFPQFESGRPVEIRVAEGERLQLRLHAETASGQHLDSEVVEVVGHPGTHRLELSAVPTTRRHAGGFVCDETQIRK